MQMMARTKVRRVQSLGGREAFFLDLKAQINGDACNVCKCIRVQAQGILQRISKSAHSLVGFPLARCPNSHELNTH
jgi:hypothetical protein